MLALVVDDDQGIREALRFALEDAGFTVLEAPDGLRAIELLRASAERMIVLLDYLMPGLDGAGVLDLVANDATLRFNHDYILITASPQLLPAPFRETLERLHVSVIGKPFHLDALFSAIARSMRNPDATHSC